MGGPSEELNQLQDRCGVTPAAGARLPRGLLAAVQELHDRGCSRQAYDLGQAALPLKEWRGSDASILAGRILMNLGAPGSAFRHHIRAYRGEPGGIRNQAYYLETYLSLRSPIYAWGRFREFEKAALLRPDGAAHAEGWEYLFTLGARLCGMFQDFEQAEKRLEMAGRHPSEMPWLLVETAGLLAARERPEEAIERAREALRIRPWYRPAVHLLAQLLRAGRGEDEARTLLTEAAGRIESTALLSQWLILLLDLEQYGEALEVIDRVLALSPVPDRNLRNWLAAQQCRAHGALGNHAAAAATAGRLKDDYHAGLVGRLQGQEVPGRRVRLEVPFIQQFRLTCVPATLTMLRHFWKMAADHVELAEALCYDGTPSHRARRWAEGKGMLAREFTLDWDQAVALLERGIPVAVYTTDTTSGHIRIIAGFDELRRTFIIRDPSYPQIQELIAEPFLRDHAASGPVGLVLLPNGEASRIAGLEFAHSRLYDSLRKVQAALADHHRDEAEQERRRMECEAPGHRVTLTAGRAVHSYDANLPALREVLEQLLGQYPRDGNLLLAKLSCLRETGRRQERLEFLQNIGRHREADPVFRQQLAQEWMVDARQRPQAERELKLALRVHRLHGMAHGTLANLLWDERRFDEARELYRLAACADDKKEPPAQAYFAAATASRQSAEALAFLAERVRRTQGKSAAPFITWFQALRQLGRAGEAGQHLEEALRDHPGAGELWVAAADFHARQSDFEQADLCLRQAAGKVPPLEWLKARADLCRFRTDLKGALELWRQVLQTEPLALAVHRLVVWVTAESEGLEAAQRHLESAGARFPHHYQLHRLWCEWARKAGPEAGIRVVRQLVESHPADAWARREMALVLTEAARLAEALVEAEEGLRLAPQDSESPATRGFVLMADGRLAEAQADYQEAIRLSVDNGPAIRRLVNSGATVAQRREWLAFVEQELMRQTVMGEGLRAYREVARLNLDPPVLLASLRRALQERPDLVAAWSAVVGQLAEMRQLDAALTLAQQAAERFPLVEQTWLDLALIHRLRWDVEAEREALEQAKRVDPAGSVAARRLGHLRERMGETARAREEFVEACARAPLDAVSHGYLALTLWRGGQRPEALDRIRHAVWLEPGFLWGWQMLTEWATDLGTPQLAEELAQTMVAQRPGEIHSLLVLARIQARGQRREAGLATVDRALERFPRDPEAHELRADILAELGRIEEAEAACEPKVFGSTPPANLQVRRARLEAGRGNLAAAIQRIKAVLEENPGLAAGWQYLAEWHWAMEEFDEALSAVSNVPRLEPLNPVPLGYRASLKLQRDDKDGAREDLELALKLDPAYEFAANNLFKLQLDRDDLPAARRALGCLQRFAPRETALAREIQWRAKVWQTSPARAGGADARQLGDAELEPAVTQFRELCLSPAAAAENLGLAIQALLAAGQVRRVDSILEEVITDPKCHPAVGRWWMARRRDLGKWFIPAKIRQLAPARPAVRDAVIWQIEALARLPEAAYQLTARGRFMEALLRRFGPPERGWLLAALARQHRSWLSADQDGWGAMGYALVTLRRFRAAARWLRDWRSRPHPPIWMLFNLVLALRALKRWPEAGEVLQFAVSLPGQDHTFPRLRLMLALELALAGKTAESNAHFRELPGGNWTGAPALQYQCVRGLLAVQQAAPAERKALCRAETARLKSILRKCGKTSQDPDYCRSRARMETDAGDRWAWLFVWLGV